jgi:DNA-binding Lrp family transcriptional regulator
MDALDRRLLDEFQRDFPLVSHPYAILAERLGLAEGEVIERLGKLTTQGAISRVGAVFKPHAAGASTLAAMAIPRERLEEVADLVSAYPEVNHNYERENRLNLWFVVAAPSQERLEEVLAEIKARTGIDVLDLRLLAEYHIDLGFGLKWN